MVQISIWPNLVQLSTSSIILPLKVSMCWNLIIWNNAYKNQIARICSRVKYNVRDGRLPWALKCLESLWKVMLSSVDILCIFWIAENREGWELKVRKWEPPRFRKSFNFDSVVEMVPNPKSVVVNFYPSGVLSVPVHLRGGISAIHQFC